MNGTPTVLGVLLIEDNANWARGIIRLIETRLPQSNRVVRWEATVTAAQAALKDFHADVVLLDLDLPDSRPNETISRISEFPEPVYVFSDHFDKENPTGSTLAMECLRHGAKRAYTKDEETVQWLVGELVQEQILRAMRATTAKPEPGTNAA